MYALLAIPRYAHDFLEILPIILPDWCAKFSTWQFNNAVFPNIYNNSTFPSGCVRRTMCRYTKMKGWLIDSIDFLRVCGSTTGRRVGQSQWFYLKASRACLNSCTIWEAILRQESASSLLLKDEKAFMLLCSVYVEWLHVEFHNLNHAKRLKCLVAPDIFSDRERSAIAHRPKAH